MALLLDPVTWWVLGGILLGLAAIKQWEDWPCGWNPIRSIVIWLWEAWLSMELEYTIWRASRG